MHSGEVGAMAGGEPEYVYTRGIGWFPKPLGARGILVPRLGWFDPGGRIMEIDLEPFQAFVNNIGLAGEPNWDVARSMMPGLCGSTCVDCNYIFNNVRGELSSPNTLTFQDLINAFYRS